MPPLRLPLAAEPSLRRLEIASLAWNCGEQVYLVGLIVVAFRLGGPAAVALLGVLQAAPAVLLLSPLLRLTARVRGERLLSALVAIRCLSIAAAATDLVLAGPAWIVFAGAAVDAVAASAARPTRSALAPRLARTTEELVATNVSISTGRSIASLLGPAAAAALIAAGDVAWPLALGALLLGLSFVIGLGVRAAPPLPPLRRRTGDAPQETALATLRRLAAARMVVLLLILQQLVRGMLPVLFVSLAAGPLQSGDQGVGILNATAGAGALVGSALALGISGGVGLAAAFAIGLGVWGIGLAVPGMVPLLPVAVVALAVGGAGRALLEASGITLLQRTIPVRARRGVFTAVEVLAATAVAVGALLAAWLVQATAPTTTTVVVGATLGLAVVATWPAIRSAHAVAPVTEREIRRLRMVPMLKPLALCTTEELAAEVQRLDVPPGADVVRQGEPGDTFYLVDSGRLEVLVDGRPVRTIGSGDSFGEIALIRDIPRTATVRALEPASLTVIDRNHFLAAVMGRREAAAAAEAVIRGHLGA